MTFFMTKNWWGIELYDMTLMCWLGVGKMCVAKPHSKRIGGNQ